MTMFIKINNKPILVKEEGEKVDWMYMFISSLGYAFIILFLNKVCAVFLGASFLSGYMSDLGSMMKWFFY